MREFKSDGELISGLRRGDPTALEWLYDRYGEGLYRYALGLVASEADAEDILQEVFLRLAGMRRIGVRSLRAYLFGAIRNEAIRIFKRRRKHRSRYVPVEDVALVEPAGEETDPEVTAAVNRALIRLPAAQREVVLLKVYEGLTFEEIAEITGSARDTGASRYRYAMKKLRAWLARWIQIGR
jgi:RNA polymerase sigma-70 factor (ECF subfamily)